jgi:hypothetical protein
VLFVCCVLLYNHGHRVKTHLQLINITFHIANITFENSLYLDTDGRYFILGHESCSPVEVDRNSGQRTVALLRVEFMQRSIDISKQQIRSLNLKRDCWFLLNIGDFLPDYTSS